MNTSELQSYGEQLDLLQTAFNDADRKGKNLPIEVEGRTYGYDELRTKLQSMRETIAVEVAQIRRAKEADDAKQIENYVDPEDGKVKQRSRQRASTPALEGNEGLTELMGYRQLSKMTSEQRTAGIALVQSDIDRIDPTLYFGRGSSSVKAQQLAQSNPALYRLAKKKAVAQGIL